MKKVTINLKDDVYQALKKTSKSKKASAFFNFFHAKN